MSRTTTDMSMGAPFVRLDQALRRPREDERLNAGEEHRPHDIARIKALFSSSRAEYVHAAHKHSGREANAANSC